FFQAEVGIRDFHVTGVQTCALPISTSRPGSCCPRPVPTPAPPRGVARPAPAAARGGCRRTGAVPGQADGLETQGRLTWSGRYSRKRRLHAMGPSPFVTDRRRCPALDAAGHSPPAAGPPPRAAPSPRRGGTFPGSSAPPGPRRARCRGPPRRPPGGGPGGEVGAGAPDDLERVVGGVLDE